MVLYIFLVGISPSIMFLRESSTPTHSNPHTASQVTLSQYLLIITYNLYPTPHPPLPKDSDITIPTPICSLSPHRHYATLSQSFESLLHKISLMFFIGFCIKCYTLNLVPQTPDIPKYVSTMNQ